MSTIHVKYTCLFFQGGDIARSKYFFGFFLVFGGLLRKFVLWIGVHCGSRILGAPFSGNTRLFSPLFACWCFNALFLDTSGPPEKKLNLHSEFWCSGVLFSTIWRFSILGLVQPLAIPWVAFGLPGSGRAALGQGSFFFSFWFFGSPLWGPKGLHRCVLKHTKTNAF